MGSFRVEETSAYCTVNHRASASNYQLSNIKRPARHSNRRPKRLEARTLTTTPPSAPTCRVSKSRDLWVQGRDLTDEPDFSQLVITTVIIYPVNVMVPKYLKPDTDFSHKWDKFKWFLHLCQHQETLDTNLSTSSFHLYRRHTFSTCKSLQFSYYQVRSRLIANQNSNSDVMLVLQSVNDICKTPYTLPKFPFP